MIVSASLQAALDSQRTHLMIGYFELRPGVFLEVYVELELWRAFLAQTLHRQKSNSCSEVNAPPL